MKDGHRRTVKMYDTSLAGLSRKLSLKYNLNSEDVYRRYVRVLEIKRIE
jgi:hypothetical protein